MSFASIGLFAPKNPINVGHVLRAAMCYDAKLVVVHGRRVKASTDTPAGYANIPVLRVDTAVQMREMIPFGAVPVAIEFVAGAIELPEYEHPQKAFYIFGPEDSGLGKQVRSWCRDTIMIPTSHCMNLAATVNVVLYDRMMKEQLRSKAKREATNLALV